MINQSKLSDQGKWDKKYFHPYHIIRLAEKPLVSGVVGPIQYHSTLATLETVQVVIFLIDKQPTFRDGLETLGTMMQ